MLTDVSRKLGDKLRSYLKFKRLKAEKVERGNEWKGETGRCMKASRRKLSEALFRMYAPIAGLRDSRLAPNLTPKHFLTPPPPLPFSFLFSSPDIASLFFELRPRWTIHGLFLTKVWIVARCFFSVASTIKLYITLRSIWILNELRWLASLRIWSETSLVKNYSCHRLNDTGITWRARRSAELRQKLKNNIFSYR